MTQKHVFQHRKYLITGGAGFIGSHLAARLVDYGAEVVVLDNLSTGSALAVPDATRIVKGDICDERLLADLIRRVDGCFHLAAKASVSISASEEAEARRTNRDGTSVLFEVANAEQRIPIVWASSAAVYGEQPDGAVSETAALQPISNYGRDKSYNESTARQAAKQNGLQNTALRLFNVYGRLRSCGTLSNGVMREFAARATLNQPLQIFGSGRRVRDFVHVRDAVSSFLAAMRRHHVEHVEGFSVLNVSTGMGTEIADLAQMLKSILKSESEIQFLSARAEDIRLSIGDPSRHLRVFGWRASSDIEGNLRRFDLGVTSQAKRS